MHFESLFAFASWLKCILILVEMYILVEIYILECTFGDHICICIFVAMHTFQRRCVFGGTHLHLYFNCNAHILEDVRVFGGSHLDLHFSCNVHLFWRRCTLKQNCIHMFLEEITLIKYYCNLYYILSRIKENKTNFAS